MEIGFFCLPIVDPVLFATANTLQQAIYNIGAAFDRPYHGLLDEVRIFERVLSEGEIGFQMDLNTSQAIGVEPHAKLATTWAEIKAE